MSESARKKRRELSFEERFALKKRRIAQGLYLLFLVGALVGGQGPWWQVFLGEQALAEPTRGMDYQRYAFVEPEAPDPARPYEKEQVERLLRPASVAALACVIAFFFASYNLVADTDIQLPVFIASLAVAGSAGYVLYDLEVKESVIRDVVLIHEARRIVAARDRSSSAAGAGTETAPITSATAPEGAVVDRQPRLRVAWGLALFVSSALVMLLDSLYLTFIAQRAAETT